MLPLAITGNVLEGFGENGRPIWHDGMVVEEGRVIYLGPYAVEKAGPGAKVIDLEERVVLPGFTDAHAHLASLGESLSWLDLKNIESIEELKKVVAAKALELGPEKWVLGRGWDQEKFKEERWPTRWDLDAVAPRNPVFLIRICGHAAVANTAALSLAGISNSTPDPPGGVIEKISGKVTGVLKEHAVQLIASMVKHGSVKDSVTEAVRELVSRGVTCVHAMSVSLEELHTLQELASEGSLRIKVRAYIEPSILTGSLKLQGDELLKVTGVKVFVDGSFGARTAALSEPYDDDPSNSGVLLMTRRELVDTLKRVKAAGFQLAAHAIGDRALEEVIEAVKLENGPLRVEHASLAPPDLRRELAELKLSVCAQPHFIISDWWIVSRLGFSKCQWVYPFKSLLSEGIPLAFSSDAPVEPCNPWEGIYAAVTRGAYEKLNIASITAAEALTVEEAMRVYIGGNAVMTGEKSGKLSIGYPADFIIVDRDPFRVPEPMLRKVHVLATYLNGVQVW
ncbi:MAG: amidohydrolase [Thermofilaceae archaeon]